MPELPEVQALVDFLGTRLDGLAVTGSTSARSASSRPSTHRRRPSSARPSRASLVMASSSTSTVAERT